MMNLKQQLIADMKLAMKSKEVDRLKTIRAIIGSYKQVEIDKRIEADDSIIMQVMQKMLKQRRDSITQFSDANRDDLVAVEQTEFDIIMTYMPKQLNAQEIEIEVQEVIANFGANSMADMGKIIRAMKKKLDGKADMSIVSKIIKEKLRS